MNERQRRGGFFTGFAVAVLLCGPVLLWAQGPGNWDMSVRRLYVLSTTSSALNVGCAVAATTCTGTVNAGPFIGRGQVNSITNATNPNLDLINSTGGATMRIQSTSIGTATADALTILSGGSTRATFASGSNLITVGPSATAEIRVASAGSAVVATYQPGFTGTTTATDYVVLTNNSTAATFCNGGGMTIGAPTGGCKGAGTLNVGSGGGGDVYKNNSAYANPDFVFEHWDTGTITKFARNSGASSYRGLMPIGELEAYVREHYRLPQIHRKPMGIFERADVLLEIVEQQQLYIFDLNRRIAALEAAQGKQ